MQQILLSSQNTMPSQAKVSGSSSGNSNSNPLLVSQNQSESAIPNVLVSRAEALPSLVNTGGERAFVDILNNLVPSQGNEVIENAGLEEWNKLLEENPAFFDQLEQNPEIANQIKAFIEGQTLSKEGDTLPPLLVEEGSVLLTGGPEVGSELKTSDAMLTLKQVIDGFLSEQEISEIDRNTELKLSTSMGASGALDGELANISVPYVLTDQNDSNIKGWGRFSGGSQAGNTFGGQVVNVAGVVNAEHSNTLDRGGNGLSLMQGGVVNSLQTETDAQFKASFESFSALDSEAGDLLESGRILERSDSSKSQFSEIQAKLQGTSLKQYSTSLETNVQDPDWGDEMGQKIVWLTGRAIQSAEIHLNPADLGPIEVQIKVQNEQAVVTFHAQNSTVRDMLESNVHRLRDMMESNGVDLTEVSVGSEESANQYSSRDSDGGEAGQNGESGTGSQSDIEGETTGELVQTSSVSNRIVDFYA